MSELDDIAQIIEGAVPPPPKMVPRGPITPKSGAWDGITREMRDALEQLAGDMTTDAHAGQYALAWTKYDQAQIDNYHQICLWTLLDSQTRSALKRHR